MKAIWTAPPSLFQTALARYDAALPPKPNLKDLEPFITDLRTALPSRKPPHITAAEYSKLITWKLARGKWRPRLQKFADSIDDDTMVPASEDAFRLFGAGDKKAALRRLTEIRGCGPASASLVLSLIGACFMGDEILEVVFGERKYTEKTFMQLQQAVDKKCAQLGESWCPWDVECAVFAAVKLGITEKKRLREDRELGVEIDETSGRVVDKDSKGVESGLGNSEKVDKRKSKKGSNRDTSSLVEKSGSKKGQEDKGLRRSKRIRKLENG